MKYILIDASLALIALVVGFCSALWYVRHTDAASQNGETDADKQKEQDALANDSERASMAAYQLRDLAKNVAKDVGAHNTLVSGISDELDSMDSTSENTNAVVTEAVAKILAANEKLQSSPGGCRTEDSDSG